MKSIIFIGLFSLLVFTSCHKQMEYISELSPDLLNCCYKTNSFWVYIDSVSNSIDSTYVQSYNHCYFDGYETEYSITKKEYFDYTIKSSSRTTTYLVHDKKVEKYIEQSSAGIPIYYDYDFDYNWAYPSDQTNFTHLDSVYIYDCYYYRVLKVEVDQDETVDNNRSIYYTNSDYGILRHDIYSDTVLISSKVLMRKNIVR